MRYSIGTYRNTLLCTPQVVPLRVCIPSWKSTSPGVVAGAFAQDNVPVLRRRIRGPRINKEAYGEIQVSAILLGLNPGARRY
jgi:hypothetical protein